MSCGKQVWINFFEHSAMRDSINENKRHCARDENEIVVVGGYEIGRISHYIVPRLKDYK